MILIIIALVLIIFVSVHKHTNKKKKINVKPTQKQTSYKKYLGAPTHDNPEAWIEERAKQYTDVPTRQRNRRYNRHVHTAEYENYIHSNAWRSRRKQALRIGHNRCDICGSTTSLQVHHLTYKHLGHELDNELVVLCALCHRKVHNQQARKKYKSYYRVH